MAFHAEREQGFALIFVLWFVAILAILVASFIHLTGTQAKIARNEYDRARARALADAGISLAVLGILDRTPDTPWRLDGSLRELSYDGGKIRLRLQDERGKLDLNRVRPDILGNLFGIAANESDDECVKLAQNISSWKRDRLAAWSGPNSGPQPASSGPFLAVEELLEVPGVSREIYDRVMPFVTVWSGSPSIDPLSAPIEVLLSLPGGNSQQIKDYVAIRNKYGPDPSLLPGLSGLERYLSRQGAGIYISIQSSATAAPAGRFTRDATISLLAAGGQRYRFLSWQEGGSEPP